MINKLVQVNIFRSLLYFCSIALLLSFSQCKKAEPGLYINEFLSSNSSYGADEMHYQHSDWVEIYNAYDHAYDVSGYLLSDDIDEPDKWSFPAGTIIPSNGYLLVWADGSDTLLHSNFRLNKTKGELLLSSNEKIEIDYIAYKAQSLNVSMGREIDGNSEWKYFDDPNPAESNNDYMGIDKIEFSLEPTFSIHAGFYNSAIDLEIGSENSNAKIYYTTNGDIPTRQSNIYTKKITIDSTIVIRAVCYEKEKLRSKIVTKTYFFGVDKDLPIISLVSDHNALWDDSTGIYQRSLRGIERMGNMEFFEDKNEILNQEIDLAISGNWARHHAQKAMVVEAKSKYGKETMDYRFFPNKRVYKYHGILLRAGGHPDKYNTQFKDGFGSYITEDYFDIDHAGYRPAVLYLNGKYWGIYNIREKINNNFIVDNHLVSKDKFSFLQNSWAIERNGSSKHFKKTKKFIVSSNKNDPNNYKKINELIDIDNYINYMIIQMYAANIDWPNWNTKYWREEEENGKWKWILIDLDFGFGSGAKPDFNMMEYTASGVQSRVTNPPGATLFFRSLLEFKEFRSEFIQRFAASLNEIYPEERLEMILDTFRNERLNEMPFEIKKWHYSIFESEWGNFRIPGSIKAWDKKIDQMRDFFHKRPEYIRKHIQEFYNLPPLVNVKTYSDKGKVLINSIRVDSLEKTGLYFSGIEMKLEAIPESGFALDHWLVNGEKFNVNTLIHLPHENDEIIAVYKEISNSVIAGEIDANTRLTKVGSPYYITADIKVNKGAELIIEEGVVLYMNEFSSIIVNGGLKILGTENNKVIIRPNPDNKSTEWGALCIDNAEKKVIVNYVDLINATWYDNKLKYKASITSLESDVSLDHVNVESKDFPFYSEYGNISIKNSTLTSPKTCDMINIKYAESALVEGCIMPGNYYPDTDAIDYDQIHNGIIRNNTIYGFFGFNSDAIDIGEASSNILIEGNKIYNMSDKGVSIGQKSSAIIKNNLIYGCEMGVGIKDESSFGSISNCTFVANKYGVATFEKNVNSGGGSAEISYCVFNKSRKTSVYVDSKSEVIISYSLSDNEAFEGIGNRVGDPEFKNPKLLNFEVRDDSPSLSAGTDADLTMGYPIAIETVNTPEIHINDIHYNFEQEDNPYVRIELINKTSQDIDLTHYTIKNDRNFYFALPNGFIMKAGERVILTNNEGWYLYKNPNPLRVRRCIEKKLISKGSILYLYDGRMNLVDEKSFVTETFTKTTSL